MSEDILLKVRKPAQYIGKEWNSQVKDFEASAIKFALSFPDLYEVGMSNLGLRIIYGLLNSLNGICCERFFAPDLDMEQVIREGQKPLISLESGRRLAEFDLVGFSLGSELCYSNVLNIIDLSGLPLKSRQRGQEYPLIIGGGPCVMNPEPLAEFFDLFVIGEAEEVLVELIRAYQDKKEDFKSGKLSKEDLLKELCRIEGVYAPSLYEEIPDVKIKKRFIRDLESSYFPVEWLVPYIQIVHDRITLEIARGCPNRCAFCQARSQYYPFRIRSVESVESLANQAYCATGYEELSLLGLSVTDYPKIEELLKKLITRFKDRGVGVSLPSIKPKAFLGELSTLIATIKKTGLTFAPEAGSERLRKILCKDFDESEFFSALKEAYNSGYRHAKLYFLTGIPQEEDSDLDSIIDFCRRVSDLRKEVSGQAAQVNISINTLIPKPHTAFERQRMDSLDEMRRKQSFFKEKIKGRRMQVNFHPPEMSLVEGVLSRGDRRLSSCIEEAFKSGARFDGWGNHFNFSLWHNAFSKCGINPQDYLEPKDKDEPLPWGFIDTGIPDFACASSEQKL